MSLSEMIPELRAKNDSKYSSKIRVKIQYLIRAVRGEFTTHYEI
jgi:hypothetical protein